MGIIRADAGKTVKIAYQGENKRQQVAFPLADIMEEFPGGTAVLAILRKGDTDPVPAAITEMDGTDLIWTVTAWECAKDDFIYAQITYAVDEVVAKTKTYRFDVKGSLIVSAAEPETWQDMVGQMVTAAAALQAAIDAYDAMTAEATGLAAGSTPTAEIDHTGDHPVLQLGIPAGANGYSPSASVSKVGKKATITITDQQGTTTAEISDGSDGADVIDDTAGSGDTGKTWSADKIVGELGDKYEKPAGGIPATDLASGVQTSLGKADTAYQKPSGGVPATDLASGVQTSLGKADTAYQKPSGGIPATDLASGVQTSLGKADTAYQKPSGGIPATDMASGVIPDPTSIIDDAAGDGDTGKVWSADKLHDELSLVNGAIQVTNSILNVEETTAGVFFTGDQSDDYKIQAHATSYTVIESSKTHSIKVNATGYTNINIVKDYSTRFIITTFTAEPVLGSVGIRRIDNAASVTSYDMVLASDENWLLITYFHDDEDASRNVTTIKNSFEISSTDSGNPHSVRLDNVEEKADASHTALGLDDPVNLFDPNGTSANILMTINQGSSIYVTSSKVHGMYCKIPSGEIISVEKPQTSRFIVATSVNEPSNGGSVTQYVDVNSNLTKYTLTAGATDKYFFLAYFHNDEDSSKDIDTVCAGIKVYVGTAWRDGVSNFLHPLSAMPEYMTKLLSYKPLGTLTKPYICLSCDDGEATLATDTIPALKGYKTTYSQNIPVTFGLLDTSAVVTNTTYKALVQEMVSDYGCSVAVHGAVTLTTLDEIGLQEELKNQKDALTAAGFTPCGVIYPQHSFNDLVCAVAGGQYGVCCTGGNYTDLTYGSGNACGPRSNMYALYRLSLFNSSMTTQKIHDYVDYIETNNMLMCAFWHDSSFSANHALLDELVSYAVGKGIEFITMEDILTIV